MTGDGVVHFVGFRDERYWAAVKVWGKPTFIHPRWDLRALREIDFETETVVFATGDDTQEPSRISGTDYLELDDPALYDR